MTETAALSNLAGVDMAQDLALHQKPLQQPADTGLAGQGSYSNGFAPASAEPSAQLSITRAAYAETSATGGTSAERLLAKLDSMDRQFVKSMTSMPDVNAADAGTPEGLMKLSGELLRHQASLTRASIGISMVSAGTTSFRDGAKQVLTQQ